MRKGKRTLLVVAIVAAFIAMGLFLPGLARAGELEPPPGAVDASGKPIPTMHTLDELYNKLDELSSKLTAVEAKVDALNKVSPDADADGILNEVDNCLMTANPDQADSDGDGYGDPCDRFSDLNNGTVRDNDTGLIWLKNANCFGVKTWADAKAAAAALAHGSCGLTDGSAAGDWRLPTIGEWQAFVDTGYSNPALCNAAGTGQWSQGDAFDNVQSSTYWSSTEYDFSYARHVRMDVGYVGSYSLKGSNFYVWPVRPGN
jgi:hypothetical protein